MKKLTSLIILAGVAGAAVAQPSPRETKADKYFANYAYADAAVRYSRAETLTTDGYRRLAAAYANIGKYEEADATYQKFVNASTNPDDFFNYAMVLKSNGKYDAADMWMKRFSVAKPNDLRSKDFATNGSKVKDWLKEDGKYNVKRLSINTDQDDFGPTFFQNKIVFASSRDDNALVDRTYNWTDKPFLDVYTADNDNGELKNVKPLDGDVNKKWHEGPASFSNNGTVMAFTRNNYDARSKDGVVKFEIYFREFKDGKWTNEKPFKLNNPEYSVGHPCLTEDGNTMFFASDIAGGFGGSDIYRITKNADGDWGNPENLGDAVNTEGNEMFPFFEPKSGVLFFASNGLAGLGGLDIFMAPSSGRGFAKAMNMGANVNSSRDDFGMILDGALNKGFFSSNRNAATGDDLYSIQVLKPLRFGKQVSGLVKDMTGNPIPNASIVVTDEGATVETVLSDAQGSYSFNTNKEQAYTLVASKEKYFEEEVSVNTAVPENTINADITLEKDPGVSLYCIVTDKETGQPIEALVELTDKNGVMQAFTTSKKGYFRKPLPGAKVNDKLSYTMRISKAGYLAKSVQYTAVVDKERRFSINENLDVSISKIDNGADLTKYVDLHNIYFDLGKALIRNDAAVELDKIVKAMNDNPQMIVELGSHTDCRGSAADNQKLSEARAKSSADYIRKRISKPERIYGKGYGETKLLNDCGCEGSKTSGCSEEEHQKNRRTEFIVIKM